MAESLRQKQSRFCRLVGRLIEFAYVSGYELTAGEFYRTPEQAALNAKTGAGISNSLHTKRLAVDFNLFKDGKYTERFDDYLPLGEFWETLGGSWGGRFKKPDIFHFSISHAGVK